MNSSFLLSKLCVYAFVGLLIFGLSGKDAHAISPEEKSMGRIVVIGDRSAHQLSIGLKGVFENKATIEFSGNIDILDGFLAGNWELSFKKALESGPRPFAVVVLLSYTGEKSGIIELTGLDNDPLSLLDKKALPLLNAVKASGVPLLWVSAPPTPLENQTKMIDSVNSAVASKLPSSGAFVDIWPAFSDDDGRFFSVGPDIEGKIVLLRDHKGFSFTEAGARKAAYFVGVEIEQLYRDTTPLEPLPPLETLSISAESTEEIPRLRQYSGPTLSLTTRTIIPEEALLTEIPSLPPSSESITARALRDWLPAPYQVHRGDDLRWNK